MSKFTDLVNRVIFTDENEEIIKEAVSREVRVGVGTNVPVVPPAAPTPAMATVHNFINDNPGIVASVVGGIIVLGIAALIRRNKGG